MRVGSFLKCALKCAVVGSISGLVAHTAFAQTASGPPPLSETLVGEAKQNYEIGKRLYESGDYEGALSRFQWASQASNDPRLLWNAAVCERSMQHYARAVSLVHRYLDSHSPLIGPDAERDAQQFLRAAEARTARLVVESSEAGAIVTVDGESEGFLPLATDARVDLGMHRIAVTKEGFAEYSTTLTVATPADVHVRAVLRAIEAIQAMQHRGRIVVRAGGGDAIAIDDVLVGATTWESVLPSGPHSVKVTTPGSPPFESRVVVADNQTRMVDLTGVDVTTTASAWAHSPAFNGVPTWVWFVGGTVLAVGAVTAAYVLLKAPDPPNGPTHGSLGLLQLPL